MPASKTKNLSSLFRTAARTKAKAKPPKQPTSTTTSLLVDDPALKHFVFSAHSPTPDSVISTVASEQSVKLLSEFNSPSEEDPSPQESQPVFLLSTPKVVPGSDNGEPTILDTTTILGLTTRNVLSNKISSILNGCTTDALESSPDQEEIVGEMSLEKELEIPWFPSISNGSISVHRKEVVRERKQKWVFKSTQVGRLNTLVKMCAEKVGSDIAVEVFGKLGRETGVKEYGALIKVCIEKARSTTDEEVALEQIHRAFRFFKSMKENGFPLEEETYGPFLAYLIDMAMVEEFNFFCEVITDANSSLSSKLGYYEMLLWIKVNNEEKIQEMCHYIVSKEGEAKANLQENYLLALYEGGRDAELLQLLKIIDITKFSSVDCVDIIFKSLGKLQLEVLAEKFFLVFKTHDFGAENFTHLLYSYAIGNPNLAVEDVILTFKNLHSKLEVTPSSASYEKLVKYCCDIRKVHAALGLVDEMCDGGLTVSAEAINNLLLACALSHNFNLVNRVYSLICRHNLQPNAETFRMMINLCVRMKDIAGAYNLLGDLEKMKMVPTANMYNIIMAGYFREKNFNGALMVLKQMEESKIKPDSKTLSYLISNCVSEEDINKYCEQLKHSGIQVTRDIYMALINAYATCGQFEKAKQIASEKWVSTNHLTEVKSVLVQALASHGQFSDALNMYEEMKQAGCNLDSKAVISLIEHYESDGGSSTLIQLLEELHDPDYWFDGCCRVILYCVRYKNLSTAVDLLKQLKHKVCYDDDMPLEAFLDEELDLGKMIGSAKMCSGLYILQDDTPSVRTTHKFSLFSLNN
ncbi:pentatricopeptide repeat-containing protein At4g04790, mitochondrial-like isoform X2 [Humulus lupulus]|uniref:pentatricopeptide repeat-containing protein At4g04790, mitochondrial-like isoform X2 n=1 Tax=Humulus lupulus TaxID=3486 RepID=UPI002B40A211|nr:pentatricopeptide repeat-containing protein At4g04790, mitochondrial-like isoform X2 [Humulus lupulus]